MSNAKSNLMLMAVRYTLAATEHVNPESWQVMSSEHRLFSAAKQFGKVCDSIAPGLYDPAIVEVECCNSGSVDLNDLDKPTAVT